MTSPSKPVPQKGGPQTDERAERLAAALRENLVLAPGNVFSPAQSAAGFMRFNVAHMGDARPFRVLERALKAMG